MCPVLAKIDVICKGLWVQETRYMSNVATENTVNTCNLFDKNKLIIRKQVKLKQVCKVSA